MHTSEATQELYTVQKNLATPSHISSLAFGHAGHLFAGSDDGSLRVYDLNTFKVLKAVRGLGSEVSSIVCVKRPGSELRDAWVAHGNKVSRFQLDSDKMIQLLEDAVTTIEASESDNDILNDMDSGVIGVIDLGTGTVSKLDKKHDSVCGSVKFIPDRPKELVSGGYDTMLFHFDFVQNKVLSQYQIDPYTVVGGMALAPPFVMSMAVSRTGVLAVGTADGRLWIGFAGEKTAGAVKLPKKKSKKWEGLDQAQALTIKVAEGPIVALAFSDARTLTISTLLGVLTQYRLVYDEEAGSVVLQQLWQKESEGLHKVNSLLADEKRIIVGGFSSDGHGVIEIWKQQAISTPDIS